MKEIPLLFSTPMIQALLAGRKTQTRRLVNPQPSTIATDISYNPKQWPKKPWVAKFKYGDRDVWEVTDSYKSKFGEAGNLIWCRETWAPDLAGDDANSYIEYIRYVADNSRLPIKWVKDYSNYRNRPGIHMNKEYARIWLQKTATKVERACDISREDAIAEGLACISKDGGRTYKYGIPDRDGYPSTDDHGWPWQEWEVDPVAAFKKLWCKINGIETWSSWVWANSFNVLSTTGKPSTLTEKIQG